MSQPKTFTHLPKIFDDAFASKILSNKITPNYIFNLLQNFVPSPNIICHSVSNMKFILSKDSLIRNKTFKLSHDITTYYYFIIFLETFPDSFVKLYDFDGTIPLADIPIIKCTALIFNNNHYYSITPGVKKLLVGYIMGKEKVRIRALSAAFSPPSSGPLIISPKKFSLSPTKSSDFILSTSPIEESLGINNSAGSLSYSMSALPSVTATSDNKLRSMSEADLPSLRQSLGISSHRIKKIINNII